MKSAGRDRRRPRIGFVGRGARRGAGWLVVAAVAFAPFFTVSPVGGAGWLQESNRAADPQTYVSPTWGYRLTFDPGDWEVVEEASVGGFDRLELFNGPSFVSVWGLSGYGGDPVACRDDWVRQIRRGEGVEAFAPLLDDDATPIAAADGEAATAAFTYTSNDGDETVLLDCRTLVPGVGNLLVILETFSDQFAAQTEELATLLAGLDVSGVAAPDPGAIEDGPTDLEVGDARQPGNEGVDLIVIVERFNVPGRGRLSAVSPDPALVRYAYEDGEFVIQTLDPDAGIWQAGIDGVYADVTMRIDVRLVGETEGRVVLLGCRYGIDDAGQHEYTLLANPVAATVSLIRWDGGEPTYLVENAAATYNPATERNRLELSCVGDTIRASVNGVAAAEVVDATHERGYLYIAAGTLAVAGTSEARFDNLLITVFDG